MLIKEDEILIKNFLNGDIKSFDALILQHQAWVFGMIIKAINNKQDAEDLCQDVFVKVYFSLKKFRFESTFNTWLYRIVINTMNNHFRKQKISRWFSKNLQEEVAIEENSSTEYKKSVYNLIYQLPKRQRSIVLLRIYQELPFKTISEILLISENSAKVSFHKAKKNLNKYKIKYAK